MLLISTTKRFCFCLLTLSLLLTLGCGGDDSGLDVPAPTQIGANKIVFLENGTLFETGAGESRFSTRFSNTEYLYLEGTNDSRFFTMQLQHDGGTGYFFLDPKPENNGYSSLLRVRGSNECRYQWSGLFPDVEFEILVEVTRNDTTEQIISGTFSGFFSNNKCGETKITEGWFDISY